MEHILLSRLRVEVGLSEKNNDEGVAGSVALTYVCVLGVMSEVERSLHPLATQWVSGNLGQISIFYF